MPANHLHTCLARLLLAATVTVTGLVAAEHHGVVKSGGLPVPGATITAAQGDKKVVTTSDSQGVYSFPNLADGVWTMTVEMLGFEEVSREIGVAAEAPSPEWDLKLQTLEAITAPPPVPAPAAVSAPAAAAPTTPAEKPAEAKPESAAAPPTSTTTAPATAAPNRQARNNTRNATPAGRGNTGSNPGTNNGSPSLRAAVASQQQQGGFQRLGVNQSGDLNGGGANDLAANNDLGASDLSQSADASFMVNGSVSRGLDMQQPGGDWFGGRGGDMMGMGPGGFGGNPGMGMGGDAGGGLGGGRGGRGGAPGGGPGGGGFGGPGGGGFGGGRGAGFPMAPGGRGGRGGFGGRGGPGRGISAFGNNRRNAQSRYNFSASGNLTDSALNAQNYSISGQQIAKPYSQTIQSNLTAGGPLKIPHLLPSGKGTFTITYSFTRARNGLSSETLVPTDAEKAGNFAGVVGQNSQPVTIYDSSGHPYPGNQLPLLNPTALTLLKYYPEPNFAGSSIYNYGYSTTNRTSQDNVNLRLSYPINQKNQINGGMQYQRADTTSPNAFGFVDNSTNNGINANASHIYHFSLHVIATTTYRYSRASALTTPYFANNTNVEGNLGITGVDQTPGNYGPPTLSFTTGFLGLSDRFRTYSHPQTSQIGESVLWVHGQHEFTFGGDFSRRENNLLSQSNPRGTYTFTGAATALNGNTRTSGFDLADFLLGTPDTTSISFGNADQYYRSSVYDAYANDQWRLSNQLSLVLGLRWDYQAPPTEIYNRLVNLDVAPGFTNAVQVLAGQVGFLTGIQYPDSLLYPHKLNLEPRIGFAWRPFAKHSTVVRGGWAIYYVSSIYNNISTLFGQQPPLAKTFTISNTCGLTLLNGFNPCTAPTNPLITNTNAIDPNVRIGYAQNWQFAIQQNLVWSLVSTITYNGIKGTGLQQSFLPNTVPNGAAPLPCGAGDYCTGYQYLASNGNSTYNALSLQLQRRMRSGFMANAQYTYNQSIDDSPNLTASGGSRSFAQNWMDLSAERGPTPGIRANNFTGLLQYSTGVGAGAGGLIGGWKGVLLKDWTVNTSFNVGSGMPITVSAGRLVVPGTGFIGSIRAFYNGQPVYVNGLLNPAAFTAPALGQWGNLGRDAVNGPYQFTMNASASRTFRLGERKNLTFSLRSTNPLNHPVVSNWYTTVGSAQFGLPSGYSSMRSVTANVRFNF